mmetsp:Transcript_7678/g.22515  ORF Transcript_7678/g.22515 Transcript_7678/m.22515 type:complete len:554 (-) Transcript_7678:146-1807(-)
MEFGNLANLERDHAVKPANEGQVGNRDGVIVRFQQALIPALRMRKTRIVVAPVPAVLAENVRLPVRVVVPIMRPQEGYHVDPFGARGPSTPTEDRDVLRAVLDGRAQVLEREGARAHDDDPLAPELEADDLVGVAVDLLAAEQLRLRPGEVSALPDAPVHVQADDRRVNLIRCPCVQVLHVHIISAVRPLLHPLDINVAPEHAVQILACNCEDVTEDVVTWGVVLVGPSARALLVDEAVCWLRRVDAREVVRIEHPDAANSPVSVNHKHLLASLCEDLRIADPSDASSHNYAVDLARNVPICWAEVWQDVINFLQQLVFLRQLYDLAEQRLRGLVRVPMPLACQHLAVLEVLERDHLKLGAFARVVRPTLHCLRFNKLVLVVGYGDHRDHCALLVVLEFVRADDPHVVDDGLLLGRVDVGGRGVLLGDHRGSDAPRQRRHEGAVHLMERVHLELARQRLPLLGRERAEVGLGLKLAQPLVLFLRLVAIAEEVRGRAARHHQGHWEIRRLVLLETLEHFIRHNGTGGVPIPHCANCVGEGQDLKQDLLNHFIEV